MNIFLPKHSGWGTSITSVCTFQLNLLRSLERQPLHRVLPMVWVCLQSLKTIAENLLPTQPLQSFPLRKKSCFHFHHTWRETGLTCCGESFGILKGLPTWRKSVLNRGPDITPRASPVQFPCDCHLWNPSFRWLGVPIVFSPWTRKAPKSSWSLKIRSRLKPSAFLKKKIFFFYIPIGPLLHKEGSLWSSSFSGDL